MSKLTNTFELMNKLLLNCLKLIQNNNIYIYFPVELKIQGCH